MEKKKFKKTRSIILAIFMVTIVFNGVTIAKNSFLKTESKQRVGDCEVRSSEIINYLQGYGYTNIVLSSIPGGCNVLADTDYSYDTIVYCSETEIIGHEDLPTK